MISAVAGKRRTAAIRNLKNAGDGKTMRKTAEIQKNIKPLKAIQRKNIRTQKQ